MIPLATGVACGLLTSSLVEYALHRALHSGRLRHTRLWQVHLAHHRSGEAQPWWREAADYGMIALAFSPLALVGLSNGFAAGWLLSTFGWAAWAGVCHARSHGTKNDFHATHHRRPTTNFGLGTAVWDRVFRTYKG